jgi:predicted dehydrogenase
MVGIGIVGIGFMGYIHYLAARRLSNGRVVALCSRDEAKRAGDWRGIRGNFGPPGEVMDLSGRKAYAELDELLADPEVQLVDLCVPNDQHAAMAIRALEAGKHVLVEKPIALNLRDADAMLAAAKASGKLLMVAHVLPFFPEFAYALEAVRSGRHGRLRAAHFTRVISKPDWSGGIAEVERSGGPAIDLHIHDTHFIGLLCGVPTAVHSRGVVEGGAVAHVTTQYLYEGIEPPIAVSAVSGALCQDGRPFAHGYEIYLERATLSLGIAHPATGAVNPLAVFLPGGKVEHPELPAGDPIEGFARELAEAVEAVGSGREPTRLSGRLARQALATCLAEVESVTRRSPMVLA